MAGHSRWIQIRHKKAITDAKKGQLFSKMVREIMVAVRMGGSSHGANTRLRAAMERAREQGLPKDNIERAIERASGEGEAGKLQEFLYEAIGSVPRQSETAGMAARPQSGLARGRVMILIEGITDNKNRTFAEIKQILAKHGAKLVAPNSLLWNFEKDYRPKSSVEITSEEKEKIFPLMDELADHQDVQKVYTNL